MRGVAGADERAMLHALADLCSGGIRRREAVEDGGAVRYPDGRGVDRGGLPDEYCTLGVRCRSRAAGCSAPSVQMTPARR